MYVYLTGPDESVVEIPEAISAEPEDDRLVLRDASWKVVAIFPARIVVMYSAQRIDQGD